jgi:hypothetical protein
MYHPRTRRREREFPCHLHLLRGRFKTEAIVKRQTALLAVCVMFLVISIQTQAPQSPQVLARPMLETAEEDSRAMKRAEREYGKLNPKAPPELSRFRLSYWRMELRRRTKARRRNLGESESDMGRAPSACLSTPSAEHEGHFEIISANAAAAV